MNEKVIHFIWKYQLFKEVNLHTMQGDYLFVSKIGIHNQNSGPDFLNAAVQINDQLWVGNVEIHQKSSDWYLHNHHVDENYKAVILHVVWEHDMDIYNSSHQIIPALELKKLVRPDFLDRYRDFIATKPKWILCEKELKNISDFTVKKWMERLFIERLEQKSEVIQRYLVASKNDWEAVLFIMLCKNMGVKVNGDSFLQLAKSIAFQIVRKEKNNLLVLESLFLGQAGFLEDEMEDVYGKMLQKEYRFLQSKYSLQPLKKNLFQFFRLRPLNFPTVRLAQLAAIYNQTEALFSQAMAVENKEKTYELFKTSTSDYWCTHYTFEKETQFKRKPISRSFIDNIIINTLVPIKYVYETSKGKEISEELFSMMESVKPDLNTIIQNFETHGISSKNAMQSQSLLQLKKEYCDKSRCLECGIGHEILKVRT